MSDSPRKLIRRAHDALRQLHVLIETYPAAEADLRGALGGELLAELRLADDAVRRANDVLRQRRAVVCALFEF